MRAHRLTWRWPALADGSTAWIVEPGDGRAAILQTVLNDAHCTGPLLLLDGTGEGTPLLLSAPGRAVYVSPEHPEPGVPAQLAMLSDASEPSGPASVTGLR